jgi:uncharacterized membrane protein
MYKKILTLFCLLLVFLSFPITTFSQEDVAVPVEVPKTDYYKARVTKIQDLPQQQISQGLYFAGDSQEITAIILEGPNKNQEIITEANSLVRTGNNNKIKLGENIIIGHAPEQNTYFYVDRHRLSPIFWMFVIFLGIVLILTKKKGFFSIIGLLLSIVVLLIYLVPSIYNGANPIFVSVVTILTAGIVSFYLAHGFNRRTTIALTSTYISLSLAAVMAIIFTNWAKISGGGTEEAQALQFAANKVFNLKSLFIAGVLIGALGVLDDITTAQSAVVEQLKRANPSFGFKELYTRSILVGQEHIASLVNTLAFAYVGSSLPLLLAFTYNNYQPWWLTLNTEILTQEIVQILVGSMSLVVSVPITSFLAARFFSKVKLDPKDNPETIHHHNH